MEREIYFAGGCFWGTEHFFKQVRGVVRTEVGYANGDTENPTYQQVKTSTTGFAETVRVRYDDQVVGLQLLLDLFFMTIDPTSLNKQGEDEGSQYRVGIYYVDSDDLSVIQAAVSKLALQYDSPIVLEVEPLRNFYNAEDYHQDYLDKNENGYCHINPALFKVAREANKQQ